MMQSMLKLILRISYPLSSTRHASPYGAEDAWKVGEWRGITLSQKSLESRYCRADCKWQPPSSVSVFLPYHQPPSQVTTKGTFRSSSSARGTSRLSRYYHYKSIQLPPTNHG